MSINFLAASDDLARQQLTFRYNSMKSRLVRTPAGRAGREGGRDGGEQAGREGDRPAGKAGRQGGRQREQTGKADRQNGDTD